jgi:hypothetical protein
VNTPCQLLLGICALSLGLASCKSPEVQTVSTYSINNATPYKVTLDIYPTKDDYLAYTNRSSQYFIEPGATLTLSLQALKTYWIDWYNANYTVNNWVDSTQSATDAMPKPKLQVAIVDDRFALGSSYRDTSRSVLLNGMATSSTWKAVVTSQPPINGTHTFTFRRDFQCMYTFTNPSGNSTTRQFWYFISNPQRSTTSFKVYIRTDQSSYFAFLDFNNPSYKGGRDTLMASFYNGSTTYSGVYPAVRQ